MKRTLLAVAVAAVAMFPYSLQRIQAKGYDFPIYYNAGHGDLSDDYARGAFVYNEKVAVIFTPLAKLPLPVAFGVFYAITVASTLALAGRLAHWGRDHRARPPGEVPTRQGQLHLLGHPDRHPRKGEA